MAELYKYQQQSVQDLQGGKHIVMAGTGCLAQGTPVVMADGVIKNVEDVQSGDLVYSHNDDTGSVVVNTVDRVIRTSHKPKPMIQLEYDGEKITTTYDHPFFNGEGYYPLYQLIWGTLEASQRVQLKLLCKQYGTPFNDKAIRCKHSSSNETCKGQQWSLENTDGWEDNQGSQNSSRELVKEPRQLAIYQPHQLQPSRQQSGKSGVLHPEIQRLVFIPSWQNTGSTKYKQQVINKARQGTCQTVLLEEHARSEQPDESKTLRQTAEDVSKGKSCDIKDVGKWKVSVKNAEPYYSISLRQAPYTYCIGRKHCYITHNTGKTAMMMSWLKGTGRKNILIVTTPSKRDAKTSDGRSDMEYEADLWCGKDWRSSLSSFAVISWHGLAKWWREFTRNSSHCDYRNDLKDWAIGFDEIARANSGISSQMGKTFLQITRETECWTGYTGTPGDNWLKFYPYFTACGLVRNKTQFKRDFCNIQTYKGYPEIVSYRDEHILQKMWQKISTSPDSSEVEKQLPKEQHNVIKFKQPTGYKKFMKTREHPKTGEFIETTMGMCHTARQMCLSKEKREWLKDFLEDLGTNVVLFCNYIEEEDELEEIAKKALPKGAKIWRVDGKHHDIPMNDTIGEHDIVIAHYASGGEALNLQFMNYMVFVSPNYSYSTSIQARGRIKRIGQKNKMWFYYLKCLDTIEEDVYKILSTKSDFSETNWAIAKGIEGVE